MRQLSVTQSFCFLCLKDILEQDNLRYNMMGDDILGAAIVGEDNLRDDNVCLRAKRANTPLRICPILLSRFLCVAS